MVLFLVVFLTNIAITNAQYNRDYFLWMGRRQLISNNYRGALSILNSLIHQDEKAYEGYFLRGVAKYNLGDLVGADADLSCAIEYNPVYTTAYTFRAITRTRLGRYDEALKDFAEAIELRPDIPDAYYSRGVTRLMNQQFEEAIDDFNHYISRDEKLSDAYINRGLCFLQLKDTLAAYNDFTKSIESNSYSPDGYNRRGMLLMQQNRITEAKNDFDKALNNDSTHLHTLFNRALLLNDEHRPMEAIADLDRLLKIDSTNSLSYFNRAIILSQIGDYNTALKDFDQVAHLSPENVLIYFYRANLLSRLGDIELAERDYSRAIELYPEFANAYLGRSHIRYLLKDTRGAKRDKEIAERKIAEHKSKLTDSTYSIYADTTYSFDKLLSFDTKLTNDLFSPDDSNRQIGRGGRGGRGEMLAQFRFSLMKESAKSFNHREYYDRRLEQFISSMNNRCFTITNRTSDIAKDSLELIIKRTKHSDGWRGELTKAIAQGIIKQYTTSIESVTKAIENDQENPFLYINRSVTRAEMIEFISSIESSFQRISIDSDPANALKNREQNIKYDYKEAISDIRKAIALHPTLAYSHYNLATLLTLSGELPQAYDEYSEAIRLYPNFAEAYYNRGMIQIMMKDNNKGVLDLSKAGELGIESAYEVLKRYSMSN